MNNIGKRILSLLLALLFCCLSGLGGLAGASGASKASNAKADALKSLGLFQGTEKGYELEGKTTRIQGLVMLIRLLGQEEEALAHDEASPFEDLKWGKCYAAYAYEKGITNGTSETTFTPNGELYGRDYITFLLRALGYSDAEEDAERDFTYATQLQFAAEIGMITPEAAVTLKKLKINRGDMVDISYAALTTKVKGSNRTLAEKLCAEGVFTREQAVSAGVIGSGGRIYDYIPYDDSTVSLRRESVQTSEGAVKVNIITVNTQSPKVSVKAAMVDSALRHTAPFSEIVTSSGAFAAINGNFFNSYDDKMPIGHVMADGEFLYCCSGITSIGISTTGELCIGRP